VVKLDARSGSGMRAVQETIQEACREKTERDRRRGIQNRPVRAMVAGIPNVGKSTFINSFARKSCTKTGNKPGVTKGNQWIRLNRNVELLDTPGILWPKFEDAQAAARLALIGSINDNVLNREELAAEGLRFMQDHYPEELAGRYEGAEMGGEAWEALSSLAVLRQCLKKGGEPDTEKAAALFLEDLRSGRLGRITLEMPPEENR
ncbi:MAG: ribosome biogenesis GTPase YlqF, partial [Lachnospiraceae bacterium]|nr:ribosome biogenesis GTPase YlqF [Lachnospiraceae bacterium]